MNGSSSKKIKTIVLSSTGGGNDYSNMKIKEEEYPTLERDDAVIVRVKAAGLNFAELMQRQGFYKPAVKTPYTPGFEASGIVEEVGSGVTEFKPNDRVMVFNASGLWKEVVCVPKTNLVKMPDSMSFEDGAAFFVNYLTAFQILFRTVNLKPGNVVLIHMAAGGVGTAVVQLCKTVPGVTVIGTASSAKHDAIKENGVNIAIDYTTTDYVQEVKKLYPNGIDIVLDPLNGDNSIKGYNLLNSFGRICHFGAASITNENRSFVNAFKAWWKCLTVNSFDIMSDNKSVSGYHLGYLLNNPSVIKEMQTDVGVLLELYNKGVISMKIDSVFSFSKIGEAMKRMHSRQNIGKILLKPDIEIANAMNLPDHVKIVTTVVSTTSTEKTPEIKLNSELPIISEAKIEDQSKDEESKHLNGNDQNGHSKDSIRVTNGEENQKLLSNEPVNETITA
jgi:NADPH:quinone reductase-like Zn-dependent oxidoreductase